MTIKKIILCSLILFLLSSLYPSELFEVVKIRMKDGSIRTSQILCCGKSGLIVWNSRLPYKAELIKTYAEYIPYNKINRIQTKNYMSVLPLAIGFYTGIGLALTQFLQRSETAEGAFYKGFGAIILFAVSVSAGVIGSALSVVMPRRYNANEFSKKRIASKNHIIFTNDFPSEIITMLAKYEKVKSESKKNIKTP